MKAAVLLVALFVSTALGQEDPVQETEINGLLPVVDAEEDRAGNVVIESGLGSKVQDVLDVLASANDTPPSGDGFQYTNIRLETSTPMNMYDASELNAAEDGSGSWMDKMRPWKKQDSLANVPVDTQGSSVSGVSGGAVLSGFDGQTPPAANPQSEAEMLLAKQELLLALLDDTEQALMAKQR